MANIDLTQLNWFDLIVIAIISSSFIWAFLRGIVHELTSLLSWASAVVSIILLTPILAPLIAEKINSQGAAIGLAATISFLMGFSIVVLFTRLIDRMLGDGPVGLIDQILGSVFGLIRGVFFVCILYMGMHWLLTAEGLPKAVLTGISSPYVITGADLIVAALPPGWLSQSASIIDQTASGAQQILEGSSNAELQQPLGSLEDGLEDGLETANEEVVETLSQPNQLLENEPEILEQLDDQF